MAILNIRNLPDDVHRRLRLRAAVTTERAWRELELGIEIRVVR